MPPERSLPQTALRRHRETPPPLSSRSITVLSFPIAVSKVVVLLIAIIIPLFLHFSQQRSVRKNDFQALPLSTSRALLAADGLFRKQRKTLAPVPPAGSVPANAQPPAAVLFSSRRQAPVPHAAAAPIEPQAPPFLRREQLRPLQRT